MLPQIGGPGARDTAQTKRMRGCYHRGQRCGATPRRQRGDRRTIDRDRRRSMPIDADRRGNPTPDRPSVAKPTVVGTRPLTGSGRGLHIGYYFLLPFLPPAFLAGAFLAGAFFAGAFFGAAAFLVLRLLPPTWRSLRATSPSPSR